MSEANTWKTIRDNWPSPRDRLDRIETNYPGFFDINYCCNGREGWMEIKSPKEPKRETTRLFGCDNHEFSQDQFNFALSQQQAGGHAWGIIETDKRWILVPCWLLTNERDNDINKMTVGEICDQSALWTMKPAGRRWWVAVRDALAGGDRSTARIRL